LNARGAESRAERRAHRRQVAGGEPLQHRFVARQQQAHVAAPRGERRRQGADHVGQPAGLDQGMGFGGDVQDAWRGERQALSLASIWRVTSVMPFSVT
jgi:hypothetical protein